MPPFISTAHIIIAIIMISTSISIGLIMFTAIGLSRVV